MSGGLMQLVAYGAQDVYLTGNPQITFFKVVYRRHTNFSIEPIQQTWNGNADFGRTVTCNINRNGDLITSMYVVVNLKAVEPNKEQKSIPWGYVNRLGHAMIYNIKIEIGGSKIDEQYGDWLNIWYELTHKKGQERGYDKMIGNVKELTDFSTKKKAYQMYIPLQFWFNRNNGLALPLIALQYHDVRVTMNFRKIVDCINWQGPANNPPSDIPSMQDSYLLIDYIYLDSEERKKFAQASHEYLIEQLQFTGSESLISNSKIRLNFNHPSKYLVWTPHLEKYITRNEWLVYSNNLEDMKTRFAKLLYIGTRLNLEVNTTTSPYTLKIRNTASEIYSSGDLFESTAVVTGVTENVANALSKIEVKLVSQERTDQQVTLISKANDLETLVEELLINMIVTKNNLTMEDLSIPITELVDDSKFNKNIADISKVSIINYHNYGNFLDGSDNPVYSGKLQLNGHDRFQSRDGNYFNYVQPLQHFSNTPADGINVYSFSLKAEDHQPTGTCNFSRIDNATLHVEVGMYNENADKSKYSIYYLMQSSLINVYTMNYNVLRVMSGMAGQAYSN